MSHLLAVLHLQPEEQGLVLLVGAVFLDTQATHGLSANTADTLFFSRFSVEFLPQMYMLLGLLAMGATSTRSIWLASPAGASTGRCFSPPLATRSGLRATRPSKHLA